MWIIVQLIHDVVGFIKCFGGCTIQEPTNLNTVWIQSVFSTTQWGRFTINNIFRLKIKPIWHWRKLTKVHVWKMMFVATLALGLWPRQEGVTRLQAKRKPGSHITYSWECKKVWGSEPSHSQGNSHFGRWSPGGLPKLQRTISIVKTQWFVTLSISLESSWNLNV
jgi:hypothetical protein